MNNPSLKGEVSYNEKMLKRPNTLGRSNVMLNSFSSCIANTPEESTSAPEMSFPEVISQPRVLSQKFKEDVAFKQLKCITNTYCWRHLNKEMYMVNSNMNFVDFASMSLSNFMNKPLTVSSDSKKFKWVSSILGLPDISKILIFDGYQKFSISEEMESILSDRMLEMFPIHFFPPKSTQEKKTHVNFVFISRGSTSEPHSINKFKKLNLVEEGNSSLCLKTEVSLPLM